MKCSKCECEIIGGFYNYPSGIQCHKCGGSQRNSAEFEKKINQKAPQMLKLIIEMNKYLEPRQKGQINTINTSSIFHQQMKELIEQLS